MVLGRRAEVPDVRVAVAGEERVAGELVARPLADHRAGRVADVVLVEAEQRAEPRLCERGARARQPVVVQPAKVDALLEVDLGVPGRLQRPVPAVVWIDLVGPYDLRFGRSGGHLYLANSRHRAKAAHANRAGDASSSRARNGPRRDHAIVCSTID